MACLGLGRVPDLAAAIQEVPGQDRHKFDLPLDPPPTLSQRTMVGLQNGKFIELVKALQSEMGEADLLRVLNGMSEEVGRRAGERTARMVRERGEEPTFEAFVAQFRPPRYQNSLTHEVVEDTQDTFELRVTECVWAEVFRQQGLGGEIGHAAVCNMDYAWPKAYSPNIRMERSKTLMQGHDCCNHRYLLTAADRD
jgi:hypothetical protein